jgi:hypothetical protein
VSKSDLQYLLNADGVLDCLYVTLAVALRDTSQLEDIENCHHNTYHVEVEVSNLALAVASQSKTVGQSSDTVLSRVECLFAVVREGSFRILKENNRKNTRQEKSASERVSGR